MKTKCLLSTSSTIKFQAHPSRGLSKSRICPSSPQICQILWNASWRKSRCSKTYSMRSLLYLDLSSSNSKNYLFVHGVQTCCASAYQEEIDGRHCMYHYSSNQTLLPQVNQSTLWIISDEEQYLCAQSPDLSRRSAHCPIWRRIPDHSGSKMQVIQR